MLKNGSVPEVKAKETTGMLGRMLDVGKRGKTEVDAAGIDGGSGGRTGETHQQMTPRMVTTR